jgi:hypothetical protein
MNNHSQELARAMKTNPVKAALKAGRPQIGTWLSLGSVAAARFMALIESGDPWSEAPRIHRSILAFWTAGAIACAFLMVGQNDTVIANVNTALLIVQSISFVSWIALFVIV